MFRAATPPLKPCTREKYPAIRWISTRRIIGFALYYLDRAPFCFISPVDIVSLVVGEGHVNDVGHPLDVDAPGGNVRTDQKSNLHILEGLQIALN